MTVSNEILDDICASLTGTCLNSLEQECENFSVEYEDLTLNDLRYIDEQIFNCEACGWWCDTSEANSSENGDICDDCYREEQE